MPGPTPLFVGPASPSLRGRRILVVEDEYMIAQDLSQELERLGVEVLGPVPDVARALALLDGMAAHDAAILDVNLGGEMVFPVAEALRERGISEASPSCSPPATTPGRCPRPMPRFPAARSRSTWDDACTACWDRTQAR